VASTLTHDQDLPNGSVTRADLAVWKREFEALCARMDPLFYRPESRGHARQYVRGLMAPLQRKNGWTIAEHVGEREPKALQRFLNLTPWDADGLRDLVVAYAMERFADPQAVLIADPTGFAKKGRKSAGVQRQYSGTLGRIDNCQIGTFLAYVNPAGERVLLDRELYIPEHSWFADRERCTEAGIPAEAVFRTRPQQVTAMIGRMLAAGVPFAWFAADEEFGQNPGLRAWLEEHRIAYVMGVPKNTDVTTADGTTAAVEKAAARLRPNAWQRRACGIGAKGFRVYDWALLGPDDSDHLFLVRRSLDDGELAYYHCYDPRREGFGALVRVAGSRWPVEECFEAAKQEAGLDNYQVRKYDAWYRHITLAMFVLAFLAAMAGTPQKGARALWTTSGAGRDEPPQRG
jgi:SRSO17 transposase